MSFHIFFKDGGDGLSSVKYTCAGNGIVDAAAGYGSVADVAGDGSDSADVGDGSAVGCTEFYGGLGTVADRALRL